MGEYQQILYRHLKKLNTQMTDLNQKFMDVSVKNAQSEQSGSSEELVAIRKQISSLGVYGKLFSDFQSLVREISENLDILKTESDKELCKLVEEDLKKLREQLDDLQVEIEDECVPKRDIDARDVTLEVRQAAGGSESSLFAEDLVTMYKALC